MMQQSDYIIYVGGWRPAMGARPRRRIQARFPLARMPRKEVEYLARHLSRLIPQEEVVVQQLAPHGGKRTVSRLLAGQALPIIGPPQENATDGNSKEEGEAPAGDAQRSD